MRTFILATAVALVVLVGCSKEGADQGGVKVALSASGFAPGCVTVTAVDASGKTNSATLDSGLTNGGSKVVAILGSSDWGPELTVTAEAKEKSCAGAVVARASGKVTLPKTGVTDLPLTLEAVDQDGDGYVSKTQASGLAGTDCDDSPATGAQVHPGATELCNGVDDNCDGQLDENVTQTFYADTDHDGFGDPNAPSQRCAPSADFVANASDCDDTRADVHPKDGGETACDGVNDDCSGQADDTFHVGDACDAGCPGTVVCASLTSTTCQLNGVVYADLDRDGHGSGSPLSVCGGEGFAPNNDDCDDGDPFTYPGAPEICDQKDNSCAGAGIDATGCSGAAWASSAFGSSVDWLTASAFGKGRVWIAGTGSASNAALQPSPGAGFTSLGSACASTLPALKSVASWNGSWADPRAGDVYLAGSVVLTASPSTSAGGALVHLFPDGGCTDLYDDTTDGLSGVVGFPLVDGGVDLFVSTSGGNVVHNGTATALSGSPTLSDLHGVMIGSTPVIAAVASIAGTPGKSTPRVFLYDATDGGWDDQNVQSLPGLSNNSGLNGVWVTSPNEIDAVGNGGTFLRFDGKNWKLGPSTPGAQDLYSVTAFGPSDLYVVGKDKSVRRLSADGGSWGAPLTTAAQPLNDITGVSPDDLWVAGSGQIVVHWHEP